MALRTLLERGLFEETLCQAAERPGAVRDLVRLLYDEDRGIRHRAASALGRLAERSPQKAAQLPARLLWTLNDEAGMNCHGAAAALAEIAVRRPELARGFVSPLVHHLDDEEHLAEVLWAVAILAPQFPEAVADLGPRIEAFLRHPDAEVRAMAVRAMAGMGHFGEDEPFWDLLSDDAEVEYFDGDGVVRRSVRQVAIRELIAPG